MLSEFVYREYSYISGSCHIPQVLNANPLSFVMQTPYRFALVDTENWKAYLEKYGFVVIKDVADDNHIRTATGLMWNFLESLETGIDRNKPTTWKNENWPHSLSTGIISQHGIGQSDFMWYCRLIPNVRQIFEKLWDENEMLVSFDGAGIFRSPKFNKTKANGSWYHIDQNPVHQPGKCAIQGALNLLPSGPKDGGFVVLPGSHLTYSALTALKIGNSTPSRRFFSVTEHMDVYDGIRPIKVDVSAGDFILWDSRTVHCNTQPRDMTKENQIVRMVAYICMTPKKMATPDIINTRIKAVTDNVTTNHWPHFYCPSKNPRFPHKKIPSAKKVAPKMSLSSSTEAKRLIGDDIHISCSQPIYLTSNSDEAVTRSIMQNNPAPQLVYVTNNTELGGNRIALEVVDLGPLETAGFEEIEVESKQRDSTTVVANAPQGCTKQLLDNDDNVIFYTLPTYVINGSALFP